MLEQERSSRVIKEDRLLTEDLVKVIMKTHNLEDCSYKIERHVRIDRYEVDAVITFERKRRDGNVELSLS